MRNLKLPKGFSLIEVLISLTILATGLLGMTALQNEALQYTHLAFNDSQAQFLMTDILERIRANPSINAYSITFSQATPVSPTDCAARSCSPDQMAVWDIAQWRGNIENSLYLPGGESQISVDYASRSFEISIRYDWSPLGQKEIHGEQRTLTLKTRIE